MNDSALSRFLTRFQASLDDGSFVKLTLGRPAAPASPLRKLRIRPVTLHGEALCNVVSRFATRDETKNHPFPDALRLVREQLGPEFLSAHLFTTRETVQLELGDRPRLRILQQANAPAPQAHDRDRSRWVDAAAPYLRALEVTDARGKVRERMGDKFRQIERYIDLLASACRESTLAGSDKPLTLCDMGSGKGYLTFAAYDYFQRVEHRAASVTGVEAREDLASLCNRVAGECDFEGLRFVCSPIAEYPLPPLDILVALHACNTATDDALFAGMRAGAQILLAAPCCHKEARPQVDQQSHTSPAGPLADVLRHGLFAERHAEMATDALRALLLEREGYRVRVTEFVAAEHTAKNVMLIATRRESPLSAEGRADLDRRIAQLKAFYGIEHQRLEQLLLDRRELERAPAAADTLPPI
ncbi:MAG: SAM-dependent methyltransferase [Chthoniobacteraceae bacterium]|nr:SAM-dependent methyltransferase [Chthoniobacteraceae bacterium]